MQIKNVELKKRVMKQMQETRDLCLKRGEAEKAKTLNKNINTLKKELEQIA